MNAIRRSRRLCLLTIVLCACLLIEPTHQPVQAQAALPIFASVLLKALPSLASIIAKVKPALNDKQNSSIDPTKKDSAEAMKQLKNYAQIEGLISKIISAINRSDESATNSLATMLAMSGGVFPSIDTESGKPLSPQEKKALDGIKASLDRMTNHYWPNVTAALDDIANPKTQAIQPDSFGGDTGAMNAVKDILAANKDLRTRITNELKYDADSTVEKQRWTDLQVDLNALAKVFNEMSRVSADELENVAEGLTAASTAPTPNPEDTKKIKTGYNTLLKNFFEIAENKGKPVKLGDFQGVLAEIKRQPEPQE